MNQNKANCSGCLRIMYCRTLENQKNIGCESKRTEQSQATQTQVGGDHYAKMKIQPIEFILQNKLGFCEGNAIKYICRHRAKNGKQDIEKAIHYLQILLENYENE